MENGKLFLLTVVSPALDMEHARIREAVQVHSEGDFVEVWKQTATVRGAKAAGEQIPFAVAYLFSTTSHPSEMGFGLLARDSYLLIEVTTLHWHEKMSVAKHWLERHRESG